MNRPPPKGPQPPPYIPPSDVPAALGYALAILVTLAGMCIAACLSGCEALGPLLTAAAPVAEGLGAYAGAVDAAKAKGATDAQLAEIRAAVQEILRLEREHASACKVAADPPPDPLLAAKVLHDRAVSEERLALARDIAAELLRRVGPDGGAP